MSTFLVIEDSITIRKLVELAFRGSSVDIDFATSGFDGLAKIKATAPRVVLIDYVLPDMKGIEICVKLAALEGPRPFVIVMSARMEEVRPLFAPFPFVIDFMSKPFKATDIVERVVAALARDGGKFTAAASIPPQASLLPSAEREAAAFALFAQLRPRLAQIPSWSGELGDTPPAKFYARRILTPEVVDRLLESLLPVLRDRLRTTSPVVDEVVSDVVLEGRIGTLSPYEVLAVAQRIQRTGEVVVGAHGEVVTFLRNGKLVLATSRNPAEWLRDLSLDLSGVPADAMRKATDEQAASGKPVLVTLAELGCLPSCDLSGLLNEQGKRVLKRVLGRLGPGTPFAVRARAMLPLYVDAYGRGLWFRQVVLERLRDNLDATGGLPAVTSDAVFERRAGFSKRLLQFELVPAERRVLALIDGNASARSIAERTALGLTETCEALQRLEAIELLGRRDSPRVQSEAPVSAGHANARQVVILEPDVEGFQKPLERLLAERPGTYTLVPVDGEQDVFSAIRRVRPALVIMNVSVHGVAESARTARAVRGSDELRDLLLVAVLELPSDEKFHLSEAGFDAVLSKPVCYSDIERLLVA